MVQLYLSIFSTFSLYLLSVLILFIKPHLSLPLSTADVHDLLPQYGFPRGLLPENVESYTLSPSGSFSVHLSTPCYAHFPEIVYYEKEIKGQLSYGAVNQVSGIQAKKLFIWVSVTAMEVSKDDGMIEFIAGPFSEKLPAKQFEKIPACKSKVNALRSKLDSM